MSTGTERARYTERYDPESGLLLDRTISRQSGWVVACKISLHFRSCNLRHWKFTMNRFSEARAWAQQAFPHQNAETVTERPWAITVRLLSVDQVAYLKIIPGKHRHCVQFTEAVADIGEGQTPRVIATDKSRGFLLLADHGGYDLDNYVSVAQRDEYLRGYAMLQGRAAASTKLTAILPSIALDNIVPQFLDFLNTESAKTDPSTTGAAYFLGRRAAKRYYEAFSAVQQQLEQFVGLAKALPQTLCHCDLRPQNIAIDTNGRYLFFDWDDASIGPVGFSLHTQFTGGPQSLDSQRMT
jgi:aminoglycoside/choline kinase family phosphotransferase